MSSENVEIVRQLVQAFNRRDLAGMSQMFDREIEWEPGGPAAVERAVYRGRDEVSRGFAATWETWDVFHVRERASRSGGLDCVAGARPNAGGPATLSSTKSSPSTSWCAATRSSESGASAAGKSLRSRRAWT